MATRKLILAFCFIRLFLAAFLWATGSVSSPMENVTLRVMYAVLSSSRSNRPSDPNSGLSAAVDVDFHPLLTRAATPHRSLTNTLLESSLLTGW